MVHLAHTCLMSILCYLLMDPTRRELALQLESLSQILATFSEVSSFTIISVSSDVI